MIDMLVRLHELPDTREIYDKVEAQGIILRRPRAYERHIVAAFVAEHFSPKWVSETKIAFSRQPITCFIATRDKEILGFACYETTAKRFLRALQVSARQHAAQASGRHCFSNVSKV